MKRVFCLGLALLATTSNAANRVRWSFGAPASQVLTQLLAGSTGVPEVSKTGYRADQPIDRTECFADVLKPDTTEEPIRRADNRIECAFTQNHGRGELRLSLADQAVEAWGRFGSERCFSIRGTLVRRLGLLIKAALEREPNHPLLHNLDFAGPAGHRIVSYDIRRAADVRLPNGQLDISPLVLSCSFNVQHDQLQSSFCTFMHFDS